LKEARDSTLFLDEVGDLEATLQAKLLRILGSGRFERLGSNTSHLTDARIVCATNRDLKEVRFERIFFIGLVRSRCICPLSDLPLLVQHFFEQIRADLNSAVEAIDGSAMRLLVNYEWPETCGSYVMIWSGRPLSALIQ
jgi:transcriptional regulator with GAF, ATPase, and Fis domain